MSTLSVLQSLKESIVTQATVKAIYGEPISAQGKTVIPVAKIMYGYGGGAGTGGVGDSSARGEGGGGGGGVRVVPLGVVEVSEQETRFVPISDRRKLTGALLAGIGLGMWFGWRRRRLPQSLKPHRSYAIKWNARGLRDSKPRINGLHQAAALCAGAIVLRPWCRLPGPHISKIPRCGALRMAETAIDPIEHLPSVTAFAIGDTG